MQSILQPGISGMVGKARWLIQPFLCDLMIFLSGAACKAMPHEFLSRIIQATRRLEIHVEPRRGRVRFNADGSIQVSGNLETGAQDDHPRETVCGCRVG